MGYDKSEYFGFGNDKSSGKLRRYGIDNFWELKKVKSEIVTFGLKRTICG